MAEEFYRLDLVVNVTGEDQAKGKLQALDKFIEHTRKRGEMLNRMQVGPAVRLVDRISGPARQIEQHMQRVQQAAGVLDRARIAPLLTVRDNLTSSVLKADQIIKKLDLAQASPIIAAQDRVSSVVTRMNAALEAINKGNFSAAVEMKGNIIEEAMKAKAALAALNEVKIGPVAELRGELFYQLTKALAEMRKLDELTVEPKATLRDLITWKAREIGSALRGLTSRAWTVTIQAKDQVTNAVKRITGALTSPLTMLGASAGVYGLGKATLGAAMTWETQAIAMEHWLKGNKKLAQEVTGWLEQFAAATPFEMEDLFPAMSRAIGISEGDVKLAERMVKLAADMAGLTPGKTVRDAMEALADAQMGEFERLKEFQMKMTQEEFKKLGGFAGFLQKAEGMFAGGSEKLSKSAIGRLSTIVDTIKTLFRSAGFGILEAIKPRLDKITDWFDRNKRTVERWKENLTRLGRDAFEGLLTKGEILLRSLMSKFEDPGFQQLDWGSKIALLIDETAKVVIPKVTEVAVNIGLTFGKEMAKGLYKAAEENPLVGMIIGAYLGKTFGPWGLVIGAAGGAMPGVGKKVGEHLPGSEYYVTKKVQEQQKAWESLNKAKPGEPLRKNQYLSAPRHALGGIFTRPHLGLIGEAGAEAVIPLSARLRTRALDLWQQTGEYLGVKTYALGGFTGLVPAVAASGGSVNVTVAGVTVNIAGSEVNEEALAMRIGGEIVRHIKRALQNRG